MSLYNLKREYEERRQALVEQLQKNAALDPATQHQIYGAIKEIENFLKNIEFQITQEQEKNINVELSRERPSPMVERTKGAVYHVARGTKRVFTEHIPNAAKSVVAVPKKYFDKRKEEARLRTEIEAELRARKERENHAAVQSQMAAQTERVTLEHPHQELPVAHDAAELPTEAIGQETATAPQPTWNDDQAEPRTVNTHKKRPKVVEKAAKTKAHPSKHAPGKKGGMHKPHMKRDKYARNYHK